MDSLQNSREYAPVVSPCGSMDQLLHLSTEEKEMDIESINTSGEINEDLLFLDEVDIEEESSDYYTEHGSTENKDGLKNSLEDEKCAEACGISIKEKEFSITPEFSAKDNTISKGIGMAVRIKQETGAENGKACSSGSLECSSSHDMIMVNFDEEVEDQGEIKVEPILENAGTAQLLHISSVRGACNSVPGADAEEHTEKPANAVAFEQLTDKVLASGDGARAELGGSASAAAVNAADSKAAVSIPDDSNLIVLTRRELELYVTLRMRECLVAEHIAQRQPFEKKCSALQRSLVRWRCRTLQLQQQLQDVINAENRQAGLRRRPQQRSVGMLVRLPSPERQQPSPPPLSPSPTVAPVATAEAPPVTVATQLAAAPPLATMATPTSKLLHPSPDFFEAATPTVVTHSTSPTNQRLLAPHRRATGGNTAQPTIANTPSLPPKPSALQFITNAANVNSPPDHVVPTGLLAQLPPTKQQLPPTKQQLPPFSSAAATPPAPTVPVPVSMATQSVFMPAVPAGVGAPLILMAMPPVAMGQTASPQFFNPTMVVADSSSDSPTSPPFKVLCLPQPVVAAANASMLAAEGAVGMLVQLPSTNQQQPSFAPVMAGPPVAMAGPPVVIAGPPVPMAGPPVPMSGPPVPMAGPPVPMAGPPVTMAGPPVTMTGPPVSMAKRPIPIRTPVSSSRSSSPRFFHPSMAVHPSFGTTQSSTVTPTQQPVVTTANTTTLTTTSAPLTSKSDTIQVIIDRASRTSLPDQTEAVGGVVRLAPSELHKLASVSSVSTPLVTMTTAPFTMATPVSSLPHVSPPSFLPTVAVTDAGSNLQKEADEAPSCSLLVEPRPPPSCAATRTALANEVIDLTLEEEEAESTPVKVIPGTGTGISFTTSGTRPTSLPVHQMLQTVPRMTTQVPNRAGMCSSAKPMIPVVSSRWQPAAKAGIPMSARVQYYMPSCMVMTPRVPGTQPSTSGTSQQLAPPILVSVPPPKSSPTVVRGGNLVIGGPAPICPPGNPSGPSTTDSIAAPTKATWPETQVPEDTSFPLSSVSSHLVTDVTWSGSTQYSSIRAIAQNSALSSPPGATSLLSSAASPCVPELVEVGKVDAPIFAAAEASSCDADRPKRTAADRMRDCRMRKKLATVSPVKKVPKSGAQRIREFRERLKARVLAENSTTDEQVQQHKLASDCDHADTELIEQAEEDDLDLILICDSDSCPSSPVEENNVELLTTGTASPQGHGATILTNGRICPC